MPSNRRRPGKRPRADPAPRAEKKKRAPAAGPKPRAAEPEAAEPEVAEPEVVEPEVLPPEGGGETTLPVRVEPDLEHADALQRYMAEVSRHRLLTREEEHDLAVRFRETQDPGNVGLMQAVQKYDPFRGVKLSSYAAWWIRAYILRYLMDNWRMVKLGTTQAQRKLFFNLRKEQDRLMAQGFEPAHKLLADRLDVTEQDVREMDQRLANDEFSLDTPVAGVDEARQTYGDRIVETARPAEEQLADEELRRIFKEKLAEFGKTLTDARSR